MNEPCADHEALTRWQRDPSTSTYTRRCARCGAVVRRLTQRELDTLDEFDVPAALLDFVGRKTTK